MEYEMYDMTHDLEERYNLAFGKVKTVINFYNASKKDKIKNSVILKKRQELYELLTKVMLEKGTMPDTVIWSKISEGKA